MAKPPSRAASADDREWTTVGLLVGGLGSIALAGVLVGLRGEIDSANVALLLMLVVLLAAAIGGRLAGAVAAVVATLSFDFFHTVPYGTLTIDSRDDVETALILLVAGLVGGEIAVRARRSRRAAERGHDEIVRLHRVAELAASGAGAEAVSQAVERELVALLDLEECRYERLASGPPLARLERSGAVSAATHRYERGEFALPTEGVELPVIGLGQPHGRLVLRPRAGAGVALDRRVVAVALSDQLGAVLAASPPPPGPQLRGGGPPTTGEVLPWPN